ncbi:MAG: protein translocase subunit SecF [archaeon]
MREKFRKLYNQHYKKLFIIPLLLVLVALIFLGITYQQTGEIVPKDVSLSGGITATIYTQADIDALETFLNTEFAGKDTNLRQLKEFGANEQIGLIIEIGDVEPDILKTALESYLGIELNSENYSMELVGSSLGKSFYRQMVTAMILAFIFMGIVVLITFRTIIPSIAVVFAAFADITMTLMVLNIFDIRLSTAGVAALLLLIGYSIDTDILMTTRVLRRKELGAAYDRIIDSMKTGLTMTGTTFVALFIGYFLATSLVLKQMFLIICIGLTFDVIFTYLMNAGILMWYVKRGQR